MTKDIKKDAMNLLNNEIKYCIECFGYKNKRVLLGYGNIHSSTMFIGEAPSLQGTEENICPFQRLSWPVFLKILKIFNLTPSTAYTTNIIKCSLPRLAIGKHECQRFLQQEINIIKPKLAVFLTKKINKYKLIRPLKTKFIFHLHPMYAIYKNCVNEYISDLERKYELVKAQWIRENKQTHKPLTSFTRDVNETSTEKTNN